jgi:predicted DNA-binding protein
MKRTSLFLREDQLKKLEGRSAETGAPVAELIRRAIDAYLQSISKKGR